MIMTVRLKCNIHAKSHLNLRRELKDEAQRNEKLPDSQVKFVGKADGDLDEFVVRTRFSKGTVG